MSNVTIDTAVNLAEVIIGVNTDTQGWLVGMILIFMWIVMLSVSMALKYDFARSIIITSFLTFIFASMFWALGELSMVWAVLPLVVLIIGIGVREFS